MVAPADVMEFMNQAAELDFNPTIITILVDPPFVEQNGKHIEGLIYTWPIDGPGYTQFAIDFENYYNDS